MRYTKGGIRFLKITNIDAWPVEMRLTEPYTIAYERIEKTTNIFIRMDTDKDITGFGCAAPDKQITGETPESVLQALNDIVLPNLRGSDPIRHSMLLDG
jgi:L-alanine-DL-glutamate epimerase-like enolase superfamily enzyme